MRRPLRILLLMFLVGLTLSAVAAFLATGAWGPPSLDFVNAMSIGLFIGMMIWIVVALGHGYLGSSREQRAEQEEAARAALGVESNKTSNPAPDSRVPNLTWWGGLFGASYLGLGLLLDVFVPYGFWVSEGTILGLTVLLAYEFGRDAMRSGRARPAERKRCARCDVECTYMPKFNSWYCPRCGTIYDSAAVAATP